jgi:hypothetical protein
MLRLAPCILLLLLTPLAVAAPPSQWLPVDQAVGDLDPLATSLRRVEVGQRSSGEQTSLYIYRPTIAQPNYDRPTWVTQGVGVQRPVYYRLGPGFLARVDRMDYLIRISKKNFALDVAPRHDGEFVELIPANTVFEVRPPAAVSIPQETSGAAVRTRTNATVNARIDAKVDGLIDGRVDARAEQRK